MTIKTTLGVTALAAMCFMTTAVEAQERLAFGATNSQSAHYAYFAALSNIVNDELSGEYQASVVETGATVDNLKRMARDQLDIGLITTSSLYHAYNGVKAFEGNAIKSKLLWAYSLAPQNVVMQRDGDYEEISDLDSVTMGPGMRGSSTEATSEDVFDLLGVQPDWVRGTNGELANAIKDDRSEGFVKSAVGTKFDALTTDIAAFTKLQVVGLSEDEVARIKEELPELSIVDMPGGDMEDTGPYKTWGFMIGVSARPGMDEEAAYDITKAVMENVDAQAAAFPTIEGQDLAQLTLNYATSPLHPGAIRYYEEAGYTVPERLR